MSRNDDIASLRAEVAALRAEVDRLRGGRPDDFYDYLLDEEAEPEGNWWQLPLLLAGAMVFLVLALILMGERT
jgi:hypothetical protein